MATPLVSTICWAFSALITLLGVFSFIRGCVHIWRMVAAGQPLHGRGTPVWKRLTSMLTTALSHREFKGHPGVREAHWFVMLSFPLLFLTLVTSYAQLRDQSWQLPWLGGQAWWAWLTEVFAWAGLLGIVVLMVVRQRVGHGSAAEAAGASSTKRNGTPAGRASRFLGSTRWQARFVEWVILLVCVCVIVLRGLDAALARATSGQAAGADWTHFPLTQWIAALVADASPVALANAIVVFSMLKIAVSMAWMMVVGAQTAMGVAWHRFLAPVNVYARRNADGSKSVGAAKPLVVGGDPVSDVEQVPDDARLGVSETADWTWKARLDFLTCTECGRCQEVCPAWNTGKPLSPKLLTVALRDHVQSASVMTVTQRDVSDGEFRGMTAKEAADAGKVLLDKALSPSPHSRDVLGALSASGATGAQGVLDMEGPLVPGVVSTDVLWDCTMCGACVAACPVDIEHLDHILDLRRAQVLMSGAVPRALSKPLRGLQTKQNPYNQAARKRLEWTRNCPVPVPVIGQDVASAADVDYVFWVGSAGAFDDRAKKTTAAVAQLLTAAGVSFAVLGPLECSSGDTARRVGDEVTFLSLAHQAIDTLHEVQATKIMVTSPHVLNVMKNEYPALGGHFEVVHHTQLLAQLLREGRLVTRRAEGLRTVTYHDPCFLGRHNGEFDAPRAILQAIPGTSVVEMERSRENAMCCGAGGGRSWMEEAGPIRIADARMNEAAATGAAVVATACPLCWQMLGSATGGGKEAQLPEVRDIAVMLLDAVLE